MTASFNITLSTATIFIFQYSVELAFKSDSKTGELNRLGQRDTFDYKLLYEMCLIQFTRYAVRTLCLTSSKLGLIFGRYCYESWTGRWHTPYAPNEVTVFRSRDGVVAPGITGTWFMEVFQFFLSSCMRFVTASSDESEADDITLWPPSCLDSNETPLSMARPLISELFSFPNLMLLQGIWRPLRLCVLLVDGGAAKTSSKDSSELPPCFRRRVALPSTFCALCRAFWHRPARSCIRCKFADVCTSLLLSGKLGKIFATPFVEEDDSVLLNVDLSLLGCVRPDDSILPDDSLDRLFVWKTLWSA